MNKFDYDAFNVEHYSRDCEENKDWTFSKIYDNIEWIHRYAGHKLCLTPLLIRKKAEYCKCSNDIFNSTAINPKHRCPSINPKSSNIPESRIFNGTKVSRGDFKYVAAIYSSYLNRTSKNFFK